jgi:ketopantoate reductase
VHAQLRADGAPAALVVGAGCVGQVFGYHLWRAGARVTFYVRPERNDPGAGGFVLYPLNRLRRGQPALDFSQFDLVSSARELAARRFDQVFLTVPSHALHGRWLPELIGSLGDATLISLQPDAQDHRELAAAGAPPERLVCGGVALVSYSAPLLGETRFPAPGTAYWLPPLARSPFSGPAPRSAEVVALLCRGGLPARLHRDVESAMAFPNAIGMTYLTALEAAGWSAHTFARSSLRTLCASAVREAVAIVSASGARAPLGSGLAASPRLARLLLWLGARAVPFPLEAYLKQHFTKVRAQTQLIVSRLIARGEARGAQTSALVELAAALPQDVSTR